MEEPGPAETGSHSRWTNRMPRPRPPNPGKQKLSFVRLLVLRLRGLFTNMADSAVSTSATEATGEVPVQVCKPSLEPSSHPPSPPSTGRSTPTSENPPEASTAPQDIGPGRTVPSTPLATPANSLCPRSHTGRVDASSAVGWMTLASVQHTDPTANPLCPTPKNTRARACAHLAAAVGLGWDAAPSAVAGHDRDV